MSSLDTTPFLLLVFLCFLCYCQAAHASSLLGFKAFADDQGNILHPPLLWVAGYSHHLRLQWREKSALHATAKSDVLLPWGALGLSRSVFFHLPLKFKLCLLIKKMLHPSLSLRVFLSPEVTTLFWAPCAVGLVIFSTGRCTISCSAFPRCPCLIPGHVQASRFEMDFRLVSLQAFVVAAEDGRGQAHHGKAGRAFWRHADGDGGTSLSCHLRRVGAGSGQSVLSSQGRVSPSLDVAHPSGATVTV